VSQFTKPLVSPCEDNRVKRKRPTKNSSNFLCMGFVLNPFGFSPLNLEKTKANAKSPLQGLTFFKG